MSDLQEALRRLDAGELPLAEATELFGTLDREEAVAALSARLDAAPARTTVAMLLLALGAHPDELPPYAARRIAVLREQLVEEKQSGTPFQALAEVDLDDQDEVLAVIEKLVDTFLASDASLDEDAGEWVNELLVLAYETGFPLPMFFDRAHANELLLRVIPTELAFQSPDDAAAAIDAFAAFFRWMNRVTTTRDGARIDAYLQELQPLYPEMMMQVKAAHAAARGERIALARKKKDQTKRKARMEKASRKKNRRKK
ncbi:MAG TPA: hypothetical protein VF618_22265 [Thermoanaerobaculia bacterium]